MSKGPTRHVRSTSSLGSRTRSPLSLSARSGWSTGRMGSLTFAAPKSIQGLALLMSKSHRCGRAVLGQDGVFLLSRERKDELREASRNSTSPAGLVICTGSNPTLLRRNDDAWKPLLTSGTTGTGGVFLAQGENSPPENCCEKPVPDRRPGLDTDYRSILATTAKATLDDSRKTATRNRNPTHK